MASSRGWSLLDLRADLPRLYQHANQEGANEWQSVDFWKQALTALAAQSPYAISFRDQIPPEEDVGARSRRRRVDFAVDVYDQQQDHRRFTLLFVEVKGAHVSDQDYEDVTSQGFDACESYARSDTTHSDQVFALCAVGTKWRFHTWTSGAYEPLTGSSEASPDEWIDAADRRRSPDFLNQWTYLFHMAPGGSDALSPSSYLRSRVPNRVASELVPSNSSAGPSSRTAPQPQRSSASSRSALQRGSDSMSALSQRQAVTPSAAPGQGAQLWNGYWIDRHWSVRARLMGSEEFLWLPTKVIEQQRWITVRDQEYPLVLRDGTLRIRAADGGEFMLQAGPF